MKNRRDLGSSTSAAFTSSIECDSGSIQTQLGMTPITFQTQIVTLNEAFHSEIDQHRIPVEREAIACFAQAPGTLDFYIWLAWRTWTLNGRQSRIPLFGPDGRCQQLGTTDYSEERFFRRKLRHWLKQVKVVWPDWPAAIANGGDSLVVWSSRTSPAIHTLP